MLYGTTTLVEEVPRRNVVWRHVGLTEYIMRTGRVDGSLDTYFNWPGFFSLSAFVTQLAGFQSAISLTPWASVFFNLLYLGPLLMAFRVATPDKRLIWLGIWFFYLTNWVDQDSFLPQALSYFFYLVILGILLQWFKVTAASLNTSAIQRQRFGLFTPLIARLARWLIPRDMPNTPSRPWQRVGLMMIIITLFAVIVFSHQLTPFFILVLLIALIMCNRLTPRTLPILMAVMLGTWISYMTVAFLAGHSYMITGDVGNVGNNVSLNVANRLKGSPEHLFVVRMRLITTLIIWGVAFLGGIRRLRKGYWDLTFALWVVVPFTILVLQAYGGEVLLRAYFFALPPTVFFAAALFYTTPTVETSWRTLVPIGLVSITLFGGFLFARYGNERMDAYTRQEVDAVRYVFSLAEPDSLLLTGTWNTPGQFQDYEKYHYLTLDNETLTGDVQAIDDIVELMGNKQYPSTYLILTRSQKAYAEMFDGLPPGAWEHFEKALIESRRFKVIFANDDAKILVLADTLKGVGP
jgi:hypothetical protein